MAKAKKTTRKNAAAKAAAEKAKARERAERLANIHMVNGVRAKSDLAVKQAISKITITPSGGSPVVVCMAPEKIKYGGSAKMMTYSIISQGDVKIPRGRALDSISWSGTFPGRPKKRMPFVDAENWRAPDKYIKKFQSWRDNGTKLSVTISGTGVIMDCYIEKFEGKFTGGLGDFEYDVTFVEVHEIRITSKRTERSRKRKRKVSKKSSKKKAKTKQKTRTYTVQVGDTLWAIAQKELSDGNRYNEIFEANRDKIADINNLSPGVVLTIPTS